MNLTIKNVGTVKTPFFILKDGSTPFCATKSYENAVIILNAVSNIDEDKAKVIVSMDMILYNIKKSKHIDLTIDFSQDQEVINVRYVFCKISRDLGYNLRDIGNMIGRDHSSIIHALRRFDEYYVTDSKFRELYNEIKNYEI